MMKILIMNFLDKQIESRNNIHFKIHTIFLIYLIILFSLKKFKPPQQQLIMLNQKSYIIKIKQP